MVMLKVVVCWVILWLMVLKFGMFRCWLLKCGNSGSVFCYMFVCRVVFCWGRLCMLVSSKVRVWLVM